MSRLPLYPVKGDDDTESKVRQEFAKAYLNPDDIETTSDYSKDDAVIKWTGRITTVVVGVIVVAIGIALVWTELDEDYWAWKRQAVTERESLKTYYAKMPDYNNHRAYIETLIDTKHEQIYPACKKRIRTSEGSYSTLDEFKYISQMQQAIYDAVKQDNKDDFVNWLDKQEKKRQKEYDDKNWYKKY